MRESEGLLEASVKKRDVAVPAAALSRTESFFAACAAMTGSGDSPLEDTTPMEERCGGDLQAPFVDPSSRVSIRTIEQMTSLTRAELDRLPLGVIQVDSAGTILMYNAAEARLTGLDPKDVLGKNFFTEVAPCTNVQQFAGRFRTELGPNRPPIVFPYELKLSRKRVYVTILMCFDKENDCVWIFVHANS